MKNLFLGLGVLLVLCLCSGPSATSACPDAKDVLYELADQGIRYFIARDGNVYKEPGAGCELFQKYFMPNFEADNYTHVGDSVYLKTSEGLFPTRNAFVETFEGYSALPDLFVRGIRDTNRIWSTMTLLSPLAPSVADYVALRTCILSGTCDFRDNRIEIVSDPVSPANTVLKLTAVAPSGGLVVSKSSIETTTAYFKQGSRGQVRCKPKFRQAGPVAVPKRQWV
ncbi:MAG: hypothetical protein ABI647_14685, partial [Gemmatimonadota bacterium]